MSWIKDLISPKTRQWEEFYRNRYQHDKIVRSTHGVNCTGGCSWNIHVKDGIVVWETQALDYPLLEKSLPIQFCPIMDEGIRITRLILGV